MPASVQQCLFTGLVCLLLGFFVAYLLDGRRPPRTQAYEGDALATRAANDAYARLQLTREEPPAYDSDFEEWLLMQSDRDTLEPAEAWLRYRWTLLRDNDEAHMEQLARALVGMETIDEGETL